jgi:hypothetical protein
MADEDKDKDKDVEDEEDEDLPPALVKMVKRIVKDERDAEAEEAKGKKKKWYSEFIKDAK